MPRSAAVRKRFSTLGALLRAYSCKQYWTKGDQVAIYRLYRFRWFAPHPEGGYINTGRATSHVAGAEVHTIANLGDEPS